MRIRPAGLAIAVALAGGAALLSTASPQPRKAAAAPAVASAPPMGWNSWDCYGTSVTEAQVKANADYMAKRLLRHGWQYIVVDIQWSEPNARAGGYNPEPHLEIDQYGRLIPAVNRFPSSAGGKGFKPLADYIHGLGLKFGIHIMRGIPRQAVAANMPVYGAKVRASDIADKSSICRWNSDMYGIDMSRPGARAYYDSIIGMYAGWGVDFIKADDILRPAHHEEIAAIHQAIVATGRPIVLSLSPGPARAEDVAFLRRNANMWRVSDDFWDEWPLLRENFTLLSIWGGIGGPGAWPDGDMLPFGRIGIAAERGADRRTHFTPVEQKTVMSLWSIAQSPLMFGGDLPSNDGYTEALITNDEVLAVNQKGSHGREFFSSGSQRVWTADAAGGKAKYLAVFNLGDGSDQNIRIDWQQLGLPAVCVLRDLWEKKDVGEIRDGYTFRVAPHASALYKVSPK
jgi:alpha-galactosidase